MKSFADVFKNLRQSHRMTQEELASALNLSRSRVSMYEVGARCPDFEVLELIADYFNVDMDYLLGRSDKTTTLQAPAAALSRDENKLLSLYRDLNDSGKKMALSQVEVLTNMDQYNK